MMQRVSETTFVKGDIAIYRGDVVGQDPDMIYAGCTVLVTEGNEDYDSEATVVPSNTPRTSKPIFVDPADLEWVRKS